MESRRLAMMQARDLRLKQVQKEQREVINCIFLFVKGGGDLKEYSTKDGYCDAFERARYCQHGQIVS